MNKTSLLMVIILLLSMITYASPGGIDTLNSSYCPQLAINASSWNVSELIVDNNLFHNWSKLNTKDNWNTSTELASYWIGNATLAYNVSSISDNAFSACFVNNSKSNRSQSLVWSHVHSNSSNSSRVYTGVVYAYYNYTNFSMILYGWNSTFLLDYDSGSLYNTEDRTYGDHAGVVIIENDAINYWNDTWTDRHPCAPNGIYIKTIYNSYCGRLQSKYWNGTPTLVQEPIDWLIDKTITNITTDDGVCFGIASWNPASAFCNYYRTHFDYINNWRLNYTLNYSANISWGANKHPRPHMDFPIINMTAEGTTFWDIIMPEFAGGITTNITNKTSSLLAQTLTNQFNLESRAFDETYYSAKTTTSMYDQNDTVYFYSATLTNFTDWYEVYYASLVDREFVPTPEQFSNNYLMLYIQQCEDGDDCHDYTTVGIDVDNDGSYDSNDMFLEWDYYGDTVQWIGNTAQVSFDMGGTFNDYTSTAFALMWESENNAPHNLHRYYKHVHSLCLIPLWSLVKADGTYLNNTDTFGLHAAICNKADEKFCVWQNWNETDCSTFFDESNETSIANTYWNSTGLFTGGCTGMGELGTFWECFCTIDLYCYKMHPDNWTAYIECIKTWASYCLESCCDMNIPDSNISLWGEGYIPVTPLINSSSGYFDINLSIDMNTTYIPPNETANGVEINMTLEINNTGDETLNNIILNLTWLNCSCSQWNFNLTNTNISTNNITYYNDSCYMIVNITNLTGHTVYDLWMIINITECAADTYGVIEINANVTSDSGLGVNDSDRFNLTWGLTTTSITITGLKNVVNTFSIAESVFAFIGLWIILAVLIAIILIVRKYVEIY